jgi:hypothetical protein
MAERDFVQTLTKSGFTNVEVLARRAWGIEDCARYPLFGADLIDLMRRTIPPERHDHVAESIVVRTRLAR